MDIPGNVKFAVPFFYAYNFAVTVIMGMCKDIRIVVAAVSCFPEGTESIDWRIAPRGYIFIIVQS